MTTSRRDWQLEQMGIKQYQLRRPAALQGEVAVTLSDTVKVVLLCEQPPAFSSPFMQDILRAMLLTSEQICCLTPEQAIMLPENTQCTFWLLGLNEPPSLPAPLAKQPSFSSPSLSVLAADPNAKRLLWQQICRDEYNFFPHAE